MAGGDLLLKQELLSFLRQIKQTESISDGRSSLGNRLGNL